MPQAITLVITRFARFAFDNLTERYICLVLEKFVPWAVPALIGNPAEKD
jgi:hypothetical protein